MINHQLLNSAACGQGAGATRRRNPDSSLSGLAKVSTIQTLDWTQQSPWHATRHAVTPNSGPP